MFKRIHLLLLSVILSLSLVGPFFQTAKVSATSSASWQAGRIIDDSIFTDKNSMSIADIQTFLNQKVGTTSAYGTPGVCDTNGTKTSELGGGTRAQYGAAHNNPAPFTCLKDFYEVPKTNPGPGTPANNYGSATIPTGAESAAQIIWEAGQRYSISPKVLLVLIHKESAGPLTTDDWPFLSQYTYAMGAQCPDGPNGAQCDPNYAGFSIQIQESARLLRYYLDNMQQPWWTYKKPFQVNNILWNTSYSSYVDGSGNTVPCGGSDVMIQSKATAALYTYTPYQPNQAALNNLYGSVPSGTGFDSRCAAYGNRNFWRIYNDWFGTSITDRPYTNLNWQSEVLSGSGSTINATGATVGYTPSSITYNNSLYVFSYDVTNRQLDLSLADNTGWHSSVLDGVAGVNGRIAADVGQHVSSLIYNNALHIFYYDVTNHALRHGWFDATSNTWSFETLDGANSGITGHSNSDIGMNSTAVSYSDGSLQAFYYDKTLGNLRHAWYTLAKGWRFENLDGDWGSIAGFNSDVGRDPAAVIYGTGIQLFYYDAQNSNLRHGWFDPNSGWRFENLEGDPGSISGYNADIGRETAVTVVGNVIQIFDYDATYGNLRHVWFDPQLPRGWRFENLEGDPGSISGFDANVGRTPVSIARNNALYVFYRNDSAGQLRHAWADSSGWHFANFDGTPQTVTGQTADTGFNPSVALYGSSLQLFYFNNTGRALTHAWGVER